MKTEEYLQILTDQLRCKKARGLVSEELRCHIEDQKNAFLEEGMDPEEAEERAIKEMGDPVEAGVALDRVHRPKMAWGLIAVTGALSLAGLLIQYLIQTRTDAGYFPPDHIRKSFLLAAAGFAVMVGVCYLDYSRIAARARAVAAVGSLVLFFLTPLVGREVNGAMAWITVGSISINIKMVLLLYIPLYGAILYSYRGEGMAAVIKAALWILPPLAVALNIPSAVTAALLFFSCGCMLAVALGHGWYRVRIRRALTAVLALLLASPALMIGAVRVLYGPDSYRWKSFTLLWKALASFGKLEETEAYYYRTVLLQRMITGSRLVGEGAGAKLAGAGESSDFVLTYLSVFCGILAAAALVLVFLLLFLRFLKLSLRQRNQLGMMMGAGCSVVLLLQVVFYVLANLGLPVFAGVYCPFLTYGGTGGLVTNVLLGLLLSIYRYQNVLPEPKKTERKQKILQV